jgi:peptidyl-dipeptidase Dcp
VCSFERRSDLAGYHPDVDVYQVNDAAGAPLGLFLHDNFSRPAKRSGAWMSSLAVQHRNGHTSLPVVLNNNNFAKAEPGTPTLLSPDDVRTLFHEFGHALHGLLSDVGYKRLSGTQVLRDFVELPSQLMEHWGQEREVMRRHARHWQTGEPFLEALLDKLEAARRAVNQGYDTVRYTASAIVDLSSPRCMPARGAGHQRLRAAVDDPGAAWGPGRHRHEPPAAAFPAPVRGRRLRGGLLRLPVGRGAGGDAWRGLQVEAGDLFDAATAARYRRHVLAVGNAVEPGATYRAFRGRDARIEPMLKGRGLLQV